MSARKILVAWCAFFALTTAAQFGLGALTAIVATMFVAGGGGTVSPADVRSLGQWINVGSWVVTAGLSLAVYAWTVRKLALRPGPTAR